MRTIEIVAAFAAAALAAPAAATAEKAPNGSASKAASAKGKEAKYCLEHEALTGSRMRQKHCLTKSEWAKRGVDIEQGERK